MTIHAGDTAARRTSSSGRAAGSTSASSFRHEALLYEEFDAFVDGAIAFIEGGLDEDAATLVVVSPAKIDALRAALGAKAASVEFADMAVVGANPSRIIPAWRDFVTRHAGTDRPLRGIGETILGQTHPASSRPGATS